MTWVSHLGVVQGQSGPPQNANASAFYGVASNEQQVSCTETYCERAAQAADIAMRQEPAGAAGSAGRQGKAVRRPG